MGDIAERLTATKAMPLRLGKEHQALERCLLKTLPLSQP